ncbi:nutritionally-regulated adipose and cardiac enriched protein homolog isoform X2 [Erpetoichthys calabaricus]|uniref:nutritionally-regulated adipose and cardiac enriched protein homolog isoform X2 n=1 Tax=Erpetoichthys calabaricus TaxID=27687 RepID=UPI00223490E6|nr:nutritionally-regulated adipose and cardiac enriched protein homolog isoform X2 [Erpetoichthys calabaricus]
MFGGVALVDLSPLDGSPVSLTPPLEVTQKAAEGWDSKEELLDQACEARHYEAVGWLCIMSRRSHALEYSSKTLFLSSCRYPNNDKRHLAMTTPLHRGVWSYWPRFVRKQERQIVQASTCRHPTSILRKRRLIIEKDENGLTHQRKRNDRRVRFQEPEIIVHAYETADNKPHFALLTCIFIFLSLLGVMLYCADRRRHLKMCEELESMLIVYLLQVKQVVWGCWQWLMKP